MTADGLEATLGGDGKVLKLDYNDVCPTVNLLKITDCAHKASEFFGT